MALRAGDVGELLADIQGALKAGPVALERAAALYIWKKKWEAALPASRHGGDRRSATYRKRDQSEKISFCSVASSATGLEERTIQLDIQLAEQLGPRHIEVLWDSSIRNNGAALKAVAKLGEYEREQLFSIWRDNPNLGLGAALIAARLRPEDDSEEAQFRTLLRAWENAGIKAVRRFFKEIKADEAAAEVLIATHRNRRGAR
jgi:hypothetical protein